MKVIGKALTTSGKRIAGKMTGGKTLGGKLQSHLHKDKRHFVEPEQKEVKSDLERGSRNPMTGNAHHLPRDGQMSMNHGLAPDRKAWQRKKNH